MVIRQKYLAELLKYKDTQLVKILCGIRRSGKSTILEMLKAELLDTGVNEDQILSFRYTSMDIPAGYSVQDMNRDIEHIVFSNYGFKLVNMHDIIYSDREKTSN